MANRRSTRRGRDDRHEIRGLQAGAADQRAIDVGNRENLAGVRGFDRAAVEDSDMRARIAVALEKLRADRGMHLAISAMVGILPVPIAQIGS